MTVSDVTIAASAARGAVAAASGHRFAVRQLACVGFLQIGLIASAAGPALPGWRDTFGVSMSDLGIVQAVGALGYLLAAFAAGVLADRVEARTLLLASVAVVLAGIAAFLAAPTWPIALVASTVFGCGVGAIDGIINVLVTQHSGEHRGADLNLTHGFFGVGAVGGPLLGGVLLAIGLSWRAVYAAGVVATFAVGVLGWRLRLGRTDAVHAEAPSLRVVTTPVVGLLATILALYVGVELSIGNWAFTYLQTAYGAGAAAAGAATALFWAGIMCGRFAMGTVGARVTPHQLIVANAIVAAFALAATVAAPTLPVAVIALTVVGVAIANIFPATIAIAGEAYPHAVGTVTGALIAMGGLGGAIFPWLTGVVAERASLRVALGGGVVLLAAILVAEVGVLRLRRARAAPAS